MGMVEHLWALGGFKQKVSCDKRSARAPPNLIDGAVAPCKSYNVSGAQDTREPWYIRETCRRRPSLLD